MVNGISNSEKKILFEQVRIMLGSEVREVELTDKTLEVLLDVTIEEYSAYINDWLIQQQWGTLQNLNVDTSELLFALTTKTLDFEKSFTYAYSKQTGVGSNSPWELKKDYIVVSGDTQLYTIPAGREVNEVLWSLPPQLNQVGSGLPLSSNWLSTGMGWNYGGTNAMAILPAFNLYLSTQDLKMKKQILQSDLTYRISGGPNGTKILHLYPIPGSSDEISGRFGKHYDGTLVWYWYYDVNEKERNNCLEENNDIIKLPSDVPIKSITWQKLNSSSKAKVRRLLLAESKYTLAANRGKFSGKIKGRNGEEVTMDYSFLLDQAEKDKEKIYNELSEYLKTMTYRSMMEDKASIAQSLNDVLKFMPPQQGMFFM
jgi:hypothetical protein